MATRSVHACRIAAVVFGLVFVLHVVRLVTQADVMAGTWHVPMGLSWLALGVSGGLAWWMWRSAGP